MEAATNNKGLNRIGYFARLLILLTTICLVIASATWDQDIIELCGVPLLVAVLCWFVPAPAGIIGIPFSLYQIARYGVYGGAILTKPLPDVPAQLIIFPSIPAQVYYLLYGLFLLGCGLSLYLGVKFLRQLPKALIPSLTRVRVLARLATGLTLIFSLIAFLTDGVTPSFTFNVWAIIAFIMAWWWPGSGGALMIFIGMWSLSELLPHDYNFGRELIYSLLFLAYSIGGVMNVYYYLKNAFYQKAIINKSFNHPELR